MRLTKEIRAKMLADNDGFTSRTYYKNRNFREERTYTISNNALYIRESGKTSWSDSHYDRTRVADEEETHRFLKKHEDELID